MFPRKLHEILTDESSDVIAWSRTGRAFYIRDMETFVSHILLKYFKHEKYSSFQRQLNLYGFRKIQKGEDTGAYAHEFFSRDHPEDLVRVRRMTPGAGMEGAPPPPPPPAAAKAKRACPDSDTEEGSATVRNVVSKITDCFPTTSARRSTVSSSSSPSTTTTSSSSSSRARVRTRGRASKGRSHPKARAKAIQVPVAPTSAAGNATRDAAITAESELHGLLASTVGSAGGGLQLPVAPPVAVPVQRGYVLAVPISSDESTMTQSHPDPLSMDDLDVAEYFVVGDEGMPCSDDGEEAGDVAMNLCVTEQPTPLARDSDIITIQQPSLSRCNSSDSSLGFGIAEGGAVHLENLMLRIDNLDVSQQQVQPEARANAVVSQPPPVLLRLPIPAAPAPVEGRDRTPSTTIYGSFVGEMGPPPPLPPSSSVGDAMMRSISVSSDDWGLSSGVNVGSVDDIERLFVTNSSSGATAPPQAMKMSR